MSEPEFRRLSFGTLRDTLPNILRTRHSSEMASICLAHGSTCGDKLIDCYTNKPFGRFHELMRTAREYVGAVFESAPAAPAEARAKQYLPLKTKEKVRSMLAAGNRVSKIATECGVSVMTVYREKEQCSEFAAH